MPLDGPESAVAARNVQSGMVTLGRSVRDLPRSEGVFGTRAIEQAQRSNTLTCHETLKKSLRKSVRSIDSCPQRRNVVNTREQRERGKRTQGTMSRDRADYRPVGKRYRQRGESGTVAKDGCREIAREQRDCGKIVRGAGTRRENFPATSRQLHRHHIACKCRARIQRKIRTARGNHRRPAGRPARKPDCQ